MNCRVENCINKHCGKGYCQKHLYKFKRYGDPLFTTGYGENRICSIVGCNKKYHANGMCDYHCRIEYSKTDEFKQRKKISNKKWKDNNRQKYLLSKKNHRQNHKEYYKNYIKKYQELHKDEINRNNSRYRKRHPDRVFNYYVNRMTELSSIFNLNRLEYRSALIAWSEAVKYRDNYMCQWCGSKINLRSHHILPKSLFPEESLSLNNGITQCKDCHLECHRLIEFVPNKNFFK